ncbi:MAG TPA: PAS domain-containing protein, partial [Syntrophomonas sp.]|nr:PAS domain-containing protein [Syntrophomonas sp.]
MIAFPVEQILHTMNAGYALYEFITDENGQPCDYVFIDINPAFEKLTGFRAVDIVGKRITQILPAADAIHFIERYRPVAFGGQAMRFEKPSINMDKSLRIYAFSPAEGYFVTLVGDITEDTHYKQELSASNELLYRFLNSSSDMAFIKDHEFRYIFVNQAMAGYFDALPDEIIGKTDFDLLPLTAAKNCRRTDQKALTSGTIVNAEEKVGERIYESVKFPVQLTSGHTGIGAFLKDITANRRNEDYLLQQLTRHSIFERSLTMDFDTLEGQCDYALRQAMHLTECQFGVIHSYAYDEMKSGSDSVNRITRVSHNVDQALLTEQLKDLWQEMIKSPQALIMNDFGSSHSLQLPAGTAGHPIINNVLSVPVFFEHHLKVVIILANKENGFSEFDKNEVSLLLNSFCLLFAYRHNQALTERERNKLKSIFNELPALICEFLPDSTLTFANQSYCDYFGFYNQSMVGRKFLDLIPVEDRAGVLRSYASLTPENRTNVYVHKVEANGQIRLLEWRDIGFFNKMGAPVYYYSIGLDVTEKTALEEERDRLLHQFEAMINNHDAVMLLIEPNSGRILDCNPAAAEYYGYNRDELVRMKIEEINMLPGEEVKMLRLQALEKGQRYFTFPHRLKNGDIRKVDVYA